MENLRNKVMEALEMKLGEEYTIIPKEKRKNNGLIKHGICINRESDSISPVIYVDELIQHSCEGEQSPEEIADRILKIYHRNEIPQNVAIHVKDFGKMKELVRIRLINHDANVSELENIPHRKFLDLAVTYYLEMEPGASATITNELMEIWGIAEDDLYGLGMERLVSGNDCCISDMLSMLRQIMQEEQDKITEHAIDEMQKDRNGPEIYVASNHKKRYGANCLMNTFLLQDLAERLGHSLIIFPSSIHELVIIPQENGIKNCMDRVDVQEINATVVAREECLSNSIYHYDREKQEVSIFEEGAPLSW